MQAVELAKKWGGRGGYLPISFLEANLVEIEQKCGGVIAPTSTVVSTALQYYLIGTLYSIDSGIKNPM